jgi:S-adenosyl methyltransferase
VSHFRTLGDPESAGLEAVLHEAFGRGDWRTDDQIAAYFAGTDLVEPGIVPCAQWHPEADPGDLSGYQRLIVAGLGRQLRFSCKFFRFCRIFHAGTQ